VFCWQERCHKIAARTCSIRKENSDIDDWSPNSRVVRAVSHTGALGPYSFANEVLPTFHHNPQVVRSRDGSYLMYVIGRTCGHTSDCHAGPVPPPAPHPANAACPLPNDPAPGNMESGISLFKSNLLNSSEWQSVGTVLGSNGPDASGKWTAWDSDTNNPAPLTTTFNSSGTDSNQTLLMYRGCGYECSGGEKIGIAKAPSYDGTYTRQDAPLCDGKDCLNEDPFMYQDQNGNFHAIFHFLGPNGGFSCRKVLGKWKGCDIGSHAYSPNGLSNWTFSKTIAYNATVQWTDGSSTTMSRRERPQLVLKDGLPAFLSNGVSENAPPPSPTPAGQSTPKVVHDASFTLIVPIATQ